MDWTHSTCEDVGREWNLCQGAGVPVFWAFSKLRRRHWSLSWNSNSSCSRPLLTRLPVTDCFSVSADFQNKTDINDTAAGLLSPTIQLKPARTTPTAQRSAAGSARPLGLRPSSSLFLLQKRVICHGTQHVMMVSLSRIESRIEIIDCISKKIIQHLGPLGFCPIFE